MTSKSCLQPLLYTVRIAKEGAEEFCLLLEVILSVFGAWTWKRIVNCYGVKCFLFPRTHTLLEFSIGKDFRTTPYINYLCITVILTLFRKQREFESQNACIINVWGCTEILPSIVPRITT